ncbi:hypothetical protein [Beijerinckia indica]|uniref:Uncharacterized protein n=1 Tax=Beijerinckia indica subsp. indica (strain ATCC 9039 / DSM 1715 / NCIMB 8712) TaxID=395963 RepID=B2IL86_BEII9|nr:hypothetical protein [Beijerinckia indica]ACB97286.1 hypothetical protein Bind_3735 [Beijerinckia indica subsp. indica ATCC 9039]
MAKYIITAHKIDAITVSKASGFTSTQMSSLFGAKPEKTVDVSSLKELIAEYNAFADSFKDSGICYQLYACKHPQETARLFSGFNKAITKDGPLKRVINRDIAIAAGEKEQASA